MCNGNTTALCLQKDKLYLQSSLVNLFSELVNGCVGGGTHQYRAACLLHQLVHNGGRGNSFACAWGALDEGQGALQGMFQSILLEGMKFIISCKISCSHSSSIIQQVSTTVTPLVSSSKSVQQPFQFRVFNNIITLGSDATEDNDQLVEQVSFTTVTEGKELDICDSLPVRC